MHMTATIPMLDLAAQQARLGARLDAAIARVLAHGRYIEGPEVGELEAALAERARVAHAIGCANGTDALVLCLMALGVGPRDAVFVPAFTFAATAEAVRLAGAVPFLVDVDVATFNIDATSLDAAVRAARADHGLQPRGVITVDLFGQPADYAAIGAVAAAHDLWLVEDAAQSFGATWRGRPCGGFGVAAATSFYPTKPLGCFGDGGAVLTDDGAIADAVGALKWHGAPTDDRFDHQRIGMNSRLDTLQAAVLLAKLAVFDDETDARRAVARRYDDALAGLVELPLQAPGRGQQLGALYGPRRRPRRAGRALGVPPALPPGSTIRAS